MSSNSEILTYRLLELMLNDEKSYDRLTTFATDYNPNIPNDLKDTMKKFDLPTTTSDIKLILELVRSSIPIEHC